MALGVQNGFLTLEDDDEVATLRAIARGSGRAKTLDFTSTCVRNWSAQSKTIDGSLLIAYAPRFFPEDDKTEESEQSGESATIERLFTVLMSGSLLSDSENMPFFVYFKTFHNTFITALPDGTLQCDRPHSLEWEMFKVIDNRDDTISLLNIHGRFLAADEAGSVMCEHQVIGNGEKWTWERSDNGKNKLMSYHKKYLSAKAWGTVLADFHDKAPWESPGMGWESFEIVNHTDSLASFQRDHGFELVARHEGWFTAESKNKGDSTPQSCISSTAGSGMRKESDSSLDSSSVSTRCSSFNEEDVQHRQQQTETLNQHHSHGKNKGDSTRQSRCSTAESGMREESDSSLDSSSVSRRSISFNEEDVQHQQQQQTETLNQHHSHGLVPKHINLAEEFSKSNREVPPTTMMIRNIPNRYNQKEFVREFESLGFGGTFDFLYLPMDRKSHASVGYCFVNFVDGHWAARCAEVFENYTFKMQKKGKERTTSVSVAHLQGLEANILHYKNSFVIGRAGRHPGPLIAPHLSSCLLASNVADMQ